MEQTQIALAIRGWKKRKKKRAKNLAWFHSIKNTAVVLLHLESRIFLSKRSGIISWCVHVGLLPGDGSSNKTYTLDEASPVGLTKSESRNLVSRTYS